MWCFRGFSTLQIQLFIVAMTCIPREADANREVLKTDPVDDSNGWWTGLVWDRNHDTGEVRIRIERWVENKRGFDNPHTWRIRPDFWEEEHTAVSDLELGKGEVPPDSLPVDNYLTPRRYRLVRKDGVRWVAAVLVERPEKGECVRLYHWDSDGRVRQKWTVGKHWPELVKKANSAAEAAKLV